MKYLLCVLFAVVISCNAVTAVYADNSDEALQSAELWLNLADKEDIFTTWEQASTLFKKNISASEWEKAFTKARAPLGSIVARKLLSLQAASTLPAAPDGEYIILRFQTEFTKKKTAIETITQQKEQDGKWRTAGYYIQ